MKKFLKKVALFTCFCLIIAVVPSYLIDPYNVFHWDCIRNNGVEPNKNYIKTKYVLNNPDKFDGFVLGSSRVGSIHVEKILDHRIYNMTYSAGTPKEHFDTLKTFIDSSIDIEIVYLGLDNLSYTEDPATHLTQGLRSPYQHLQNVKDLCSLYINPSWTLQSLTTIMKNNGIEGYEDFYDYGWWCEYNHISGYDWENATPSVGGTFRLQETLSEISNIKHLCDDNGIQLIVFTNPMYNVTYTDAIENHQYYDFLQQLSTITEFYNFSSLNSITTNSDYYVDTSHYNAEAADLLIDAMCFDNVDAILFNQGFGWYVTESNVDELIDLLKSQY